jgi:hypothetical protein
MSRSLDRRPRAAAPRRPDCEARCPYRAPRRPDCEARR